MRHVLSLGSGDDFMYEHLVAAQFPGVTVVTADCFQFDTTVTRRFKDGSSNIIILPVCRTEHAVIRASLSSSARPYLCDKFAE